MAGLTIAGVARAAGVSVETVRYYQRRGLLETPERPTGGGQAGGIRRYDDDAIGRLRFIRSAKAAGFTLEEIRELLALHATQDRARARELAQARIDALDARITELQNARQSLQRLARECGHGSAGPCPILTSFDHSGFDHSGA